MLHVLVMLVASTGWLPGAEPANKETFIVGQIFITGNEATPDCLYVAPLQLYSGEIITRAALHAAEKRLTPLQVLGIGTEVTLLDPARDSEVKDVAVHVKETSFTWLVIRICQVARSLLERLGKCQPIAQ